MRRALITLLLLFGFVCAAQQVSYWFRGFQRQPSAADARRYLFGATNNPSPGDALRWDGTNIYWAP